MVFFFYYLIDHSSSQCRGLLVLFLFDFLLVPYANLWLESGNRDPKQTIKYTSVILHGPSVFPAMMKINGVLYNQSSSVAFDETSSCWSVSKAPNFLAFHRSPQGSLVSIGQHLVTTRVVHLPKRTEISLIIESTQADLITE